MKPPILFIFIALGIYAAGNLYLYIRGWQSLEILGRGRIWFAAAFWVTASIFIITMFLQMRGGLGIPSIFSTIGGVWLAILLYGFLILMAIDLLRLCGRAFHIQPAIIYRNCLIPKMLLFAAVSLAITAILAIGYRNAHRPKAVHHTIAINKQAGQRTSLRIVMASDIHLGHINGQKSLARIVTAINRQNPDIVLLAGDIFDGAYPIVISKNMGTEFNRLQTRYGTYAVSGNHEYIGAMGNPAAIDVMNRYLASHGVCPLEDAAIRIDNSFYIAGRKDLAAARRKTIPELLQDADHTLPIIMLDHQPCHLEAAVRAGVDLQLSGHTHHGQLWPLNCLTRRLYECDWGYLQKGQSPFYVSCGAGTWGPPIRTAGHSEVLVIDLQFSPPSNP